MRVPVLNVHCAICGVSTVLPIRVDNRMVAETLREVIFQQYLAFCRDEGVKFQPASSSPQDYAVYPANEQGISIPGASAFSGGKLNAETIRDQLVALPSPYFAVIMIGSAFLERDAILQDETLERSVILDKRDKLMSSLAYMEQISCEKVIELQLFRERQENLVSKVEDMMLYAFVAYKRYQEKIDKEEQQLVQLDLVWRTKCVPWILCRMEEVETEKRMFLSSSMLAVKSLMASMRGLMDSEASFSPVL